MAVGAALLVLLTACNNTELGINTEGGEFGNATMNNTLIQTGQLDYAVALGGRFAAEVPTTVNFEFNSSTLDGQAQAALDQQANWIRQFPEVRFRVYGHADRVGSNGYNHALGLRRARAVVSYLNSRGISRSRLEAMVSYGETRPVVDTLGPEVRNRRTVTEVSGFVQNHPLILNGKYAAVIMRSYLTLAERPHPSNKPIVTQTNPGS
jgi:outer membrane protein OmpA-like peptidoglycan-associated protein